MSSDLEAGVCPVCGVRVSLRGMPYAQSHIYGPVLDTLTGQEYPGHPVKPGDALDPDTHPPME